MVTGAHLVGSINAESAEDAMARAALTLGAYLRRLPDGETGERLGWIGWQIGPLTAAGFTPVEATGRYRDEALPQFAAPDGTIEFGRLGYADAALASWATFSRLQEQGVIPPHVRFQVSLPTPQAVVSAWVRLEDRERSLEAYRAALFLELYEILAGIPHERLAVQWDVAVEIGILDGPFEDPSDFETIVGRLGLLGAHVPEPVELGYHLCYGDYGHEHFRQPDSLELCVALADRLFAEVRRPITWIHMPVPRHVTSADYFTPLHGYRPKAGTELYLGIVYDRAGIETSRKLADLAQAALRAGQTFGVATECGMGRTPAEDIDATLERHAAVTSPIELEEAAVG